MVLGRYKKVQKESNKVEMFLEYFIMLEHIFNIEEIHSRISKKRKKGY